MLSRDHVSLELHKVLELLAAQTAFPDAAEAARALEPCAALSGARRLLADTGAAYDLLARSGSPSFGRVKNVGGALRRAQAGASLSLRELLDVAEVLRVIRSLADWRGSCEGSATCLDDRFSVLSPNKHLETLIGGAIASEDELYDKASPALAELRRKLRAASQRVREQLDKLVRSASHQKLLQDAVVTLRDGRFVVPVKAEHRGEVPGLVHDTSASGATVFVEPMGVVEANNDIRLLQAQEKEEIERIVAALSAETGVFADAIGADYAIVVELNVIFAKAQLGYAMRASMPALTDSGCVCLRRARHPLLDPQTAVPIDVELGGDFDTLVITGPNTGGKTVTLKTLGLLTLMAMCGLMPPVGDGSTLSVFPHILSDIGDEQSIEQSLSTFSAHMTNLVRILDAVEDGEGGLVLLDELGAGTDPVEGAALAIAILERLRDRGCRVAATTHYAELKAFAIHTPGVENGSCEFDVGTLRPTYRLLVGVPGRSNAFAISRRLGLPEALVTRADSLLSGDSRRMEEVVVRLDERRQQLERALAAAEEDGRQARRAREDALAQLETLRAGQARELEHAKAEARKLAERARAQAEALLAEVDAIRKDKDARDFAARAGEAKQALRRGLRGVEDALDPVADAAGITAKRQQGYVLPRPLRQGDEVWLADIDKVGVVASPPDKSGSVDVQVGLIRTRVPVKNLRLREGGGAPAPAKPRKTGDTPLRSAQTECDLRGMTSEEALETADRFLDAAAMAGLERVTLIHGKGTGALRSAVTQHLRRHPHVRSSRLGAYGEGESGVTIVELK